MKSINKKTKIMIFVSILLCILSFVFYTYCIYFINDKNKIIDDLEVYIVSQTKKQSEINSLKNELKKTTDKRESLSSHLVLTSNVVKFLENVESLVKESNTEVKISSVEFTKDKPVKLEVSFKAVGSFESLYKLLRLTENIPFEVEFKRVSFDADSQDKNILGKRSWTM